MKNDQGYCRNIPTVPSKNFKIKKVLKYALLVTYKLIQGFIPSKIRTWAGVICITPMPLVVGNQYFLMTQSLITLPY